MNNDHLHEMPNRLTIVMAYLLGASSLCTIAVSGIHIALGSRAVSIIGLSVAVVIVVSGTIATYASQRFRRFLIELVNEFIDEERDWFIAGLALSVVFAIIAVIIAIRDS